MKNRIIYKITLILFTTFVSCKSQVKNQLDPVHKLENYSFNKKSSLLDKIQPTPGFVLDYLIYLDSKSNYRDYKLSQKETEIMSEHLSLIPGSYKEILRERLIGIYFIENFWGGGMTDFVVGTNNDIYTIIYLNPILLNMTLNEAFLLKEKSCYIRDNNNYKLEVNISDEFNGILYILLHEMTHAVDYIENITPFTHKSLLNYIKEEGSKDFISNVWTDYSTINSKYKSPIFDRITFYGFNNGPYINIKDSIELYKELEKTPFLTPYSTFSWAEDIADLYSIYYLTSELNCNFEISVKINDKVAYTYTPFKRELIKKRVEMIVF